MTKNYWKKWKKILESESSEVDEDFGSNDSVRDPYFQDHSSSSSEDAQSEEELSDDVANDNPANTLTVTSEWKEVTGNNQALFAFMENEGINPNLVISDFTELNAYSLLVTEELLIMVIETNRNAQQVLEK